MILRSTLEKHASLHKGEKHLSPKARKMVFHGGYLRGRDISRVENHIKFPGTELECHSLKITRQARRANDKEKTTTTGTLFEEPQSDVVAEMQDPGVMLRARRIEGLARSMKRSVMAGLLFVMVGNNLVNEQTADSREPETPRDIPVNLVDCEPLAGPDVMFVPIEPEQIADLQAGGAKLCESENKPYHIYERIVTVA